MASNATPPAVPDYTGAAEKTEQSAQSALDKQTTANRPDQTDIYGNKSSWSFDPATGKWSQATTLSGPNQSALDQTNAARSGLMGQIGANFSTPMSTDGLQGYGTLGTDGLPQGGDVSKLGAGMFNMDPMGNSKAIQDATYGLLTPQRDMARASEIQRLKNQGLTEDSPAFQRAMLRQGQADTDAQLKSLIAGQTEYGNQFARAKGENQQNFDQNNTAQMMAEKLRGDRFSENTDVANFANKLRGQQLDERSALRDQPLKELASLMSSGGVPKTDFGTFANAGSTGGVDYMSPLANTYRDLIANNNQTAATKNANTSGLIDIFGQILGGSNGSGGSVGGDVWGTLKDYLSKVGG
jgi:hypothetical protein